MYNIILVVVYNIVIQNFYRLYSIQSYCEILTIFPMLYIISWELIYFIVVYISLEGSFKNSLSQADTFTLAHLSPPSSG